MELFKSMGFETIALEEKNDDKSWSFEHDHHWSCYGHEEAAKQISEYLN